MLQVGKTYRVASPESSVHMGLAGSVKITREEKGKFLGDNGDWYYIDGRHVLEYPLLGSDMFDLVSEVDD